MTLSIGLIGPNGFIGQSLVRRFPQLDFDLKLIDRQQFHEILTRSLFNEVIECDYLIWLATSVNPVTAQGNKILVDRDLFEFKEFLKGLKNLRSAFTPTILFVSSGGCIYSGDDSPFSENSKADGSNSYGKLKKLQELLLQASGLSNVIVRASNIYGPGQGVGRGQGVIAEWVAAAKESRPINVYGSLENSRDFLFIDDFVDAIKAIIQVGFLGTINVGSGSPIALSEILRCIEATRRTKLQVENFPSRNTDRPHYFLDITLASKTLGWAPQTSILQGIKQTYEIL